MHIDWLAHHPDVIPQLARWHCAEWGHLYPERTVTDFARAMQERTNTDRLPLALVAFDGPALVGTAYLKIQDMDTHPELSPWLAGVYVDAPHRGKGIGSALVQAIEDTARDLAIPRLYLYTSDREHFYLRLGWTVREWAVYRGTGVTVMEKGW